MQREKKREREKERERERARRGETERERERGREETLPAEAGVWNATRQRCDPVCGRAARALDLASKC